ncbi:MAG: aminotransferase class V-fold PLP-dependent enzyme, partial [Phycisphaerae bacterium]
MIYLDNNATTQPDPRVVAAMAECLTTNYANPSSTHRFGQEARQAVEQARYQVAQLLNCSTRELLFTSGGTEADNAALLGLLPARPDAKTILTSAVEHSAVRQPLEALAKRGYRIVTIGVDTAGRLDMTALEIALGDPAVALASIMWANNETVVIFDIAAIGALARRNRVPLHVDGVQAAGKLPIDLTGAHQDIDLLSLSAHKFHGPKGVGALFVRRGVNWTPLLRGGPQERDRRGGTENVPGIVGMGQATALAQAELAAGTGTVRIAGLRDRLERGLLER